MKNKIGLLALAAFPLLAIQGSAPDKKRISLFDGRTFNGWEGDTIKTWKIVDGTIVGGSLIESVPRNNFLCTKRTYSDFQLTMKVKLLGTEGLVNSGVQFHSGRAKNPDYEMIGYQADIGRGYWGSLYDESRRNRTLAGPSSVTVGKILKSNGWNDLGIRCEEGRVRIWLNGVQTVEYREDDPSILQEGIIGLQIHGGGKAQVAFDDIFIKELR